MLAVIKTGGKQYKVRKGDFISVEKLPYEVGKSVEFDEILMTEVNGKVVLGNPLVSGVKVKANVIAQKRRGTVFIFKKSHRKNYRRKNGHRQPVTVLQIEEIK
ncbi:MAG: 50S ribosomal protein L21 [Alphaproteobacteria bacterium]|nr:50S ribosomal protein L21 [Alphaproteobacteria bacterium]